MASSQPVILILGGGVNTGVATAKKFHAAGWRVAYVARSEKTEFKPYNDLFIQADLSDPSTLQTVFDRVEHELGIPNVITYLAFAATYSQDKDDLFAGISVEAYAKDLQVIVTSNFAAIKSAINGFKGLPSDAFKTYVYIGNMCAGLIVSQVVTVGVGENASLYAIELAAAAYGDLASWYNIDERDKDGNSVMGNIDGKAHADLFWDLATDKKQHEINYTFVKGQGYTSFEVPPSRPVKSFEELRRIANGQS